MINEVKISQIKIEYVTVQLKEFIQEEADFVLMNPIPDDWAAIYDIPKGKRVIYIYRDYYYGDGGCSEQDVGFLVLKLEECIDTSDLREFCLSNLDRIIHANPDDR